MCRAWSSCRNLRSQTRARFSYGVSNAALLALNEIIAIYTEKDLTPIRGFSQGMNQLFIRLPKASAGASNI